MEIFISEQGLSYYRSGKKSTLTDARGVFELKNVSVVAALVIPYTGYQKKDIKAGQANHPMVVLSIAKNQLDETQVTAYGMTTDRLSIGNFTTIKAKPNTHYRAK